MAADSPNPQLHITTIPCFACGYNTSRVVTAVCLPLCDTFSPPCSSTVKPSSQVVGFPSDVLCAAGAPCVPHPLRSRLGQNTILDQTLRPARDFVKVRFEPAATVFPVVRFVVGQHQL